MVFLSLSYLSLCVCEFVATRVMRATYSAVCHGLLRCTHVTSCASHVSHVVDGTVPCVKQVFTSARDDCLLFCPSELFVFGTCSQEGAALGAGQNSIAYEDVRAMAYQKGQLKVANQLLGDIVYPEMDTEGGGVDATG